MKNNWSEPDANGIIHMPDELDGLFNKVGMQINFMVYSDKNKIQTICDIISICQDFFKVPAFESQVAFKLGELLYHLENCNDYFERLKIAKGIVSCYHLLGVSKEIYFDGMFHFEII